MAEPGQILGVDWDHIRTPRGTILLADPREGTREEYESVLTPDLTLDDMLDDLAVAEAVAAASTPVPVRSDVALPAPWSAASAHDTTEDQNHDGTGGDDVRA